MTPSIPAATAVCVVRVQVEVGEERAEIEIGVVRVGVEVGVELAAAGAEIETRSV
eukprot:CAMPEP_0195059234 /NCGR_PEP_ID=MMETSP0448-20130528/6771_1 /TAXON_ID=66468 /ORGANISM="Heterocapsa triquestra, Strain CCMP 448" /LENGTH=54 /DNA_ID=CAMNT_0040089461 /DNA_START=426 /DNA_END=591 /DNA_ORIENTATION=+